MPLNMGMLILQSELLHLKLMKSGIQRKLIFEAKFPKNIKIMKKTLFQVQFWLIHILIDVNFLRSSNRKSCCLSFETKTLNHKHWFFFSKTFFSKSTKILNITTFFYGDEIESDYTWSFLLPRRICWYFTFNFLNIFLACI